METTAASLETVPPALRRLAGLATLIPADLDRLREVEGASRTAEAKRDFTTGLIDSAGRALVLEGWAMRACLLPDGRRQITDVFLPGDIIAPRSTDKHSPFSFGAITHVRWSALPPSLEPASGLAKAISAVELLQEQFLRRHVVRLGRLDAMDRVADWLLELQGRLNAAGLCAGNSMPLPLTQELIADALGLTSVHVNRMLSALRRDHLIDVQNGRALILDANRCRARVALH